MWHIIRIYYRLFGKLLDHCFLLIVISIFFVIFASSRNSHADLVSQLTEKVHAPIKTSGKNSMDKENRVLPENYSSERVIVKFKDGIQYTDKVTAADNANIQILRDLKNTGISIFNVRNKNQSIEQIVSKLRESEFVEYAEPDYMVQLESTPNDPKFSSLWGLHNTGQSSGTVDADIDAPEAWDIHTGNSNVVVAVIDTGVDYTHEDLAANMWVNPGEISGNGIDDDNNGYIDDIYGIDSFNNDGDPFDDYFHGTHVAGTIGAVGDNGIGVTGVNWNVKIMACKFLDSKGNGFISGAIECLDYVIAMKAAGVHIKVLNNSWGGVPFSQALYDSILATQNNDMLFVAAAGNSKSDNDSSPTYPSSFNLDNIIAVASTNKNDSLSSFSNYGLTSVDLGAPGSKILSTKPGNAYSTLSGTSMAAPHVAGAAALIWSCYPTYSQADVKNCILINVEPLPALSGKTVSGGRLNIYNTLSGTSGRELLAHYTFDEGTGSIASDTTGKGHNGLIYGAVYSAGKNGTGLYFDGVDNYVDIGDIDLTDAFTISAWIKLSELNKYMIIGKTFDIYQLYVKDAGLLVFQRNSGTAIRYNAGLIKDVWYHVVLTFDTNNGTLLYLDGTKVATDGDTSVTNKNDVTTKIGASGWTMQSFFHGTIDEVRIYNYALTSQEVQNLYALSNDMEAYWPFDEGSGTNASDLSGNGHNGTIHGAIFTTAGSGTGLNFDGFDDYVDVGDIVLTDAFTISAWINISGMNKNMIVGKTFSTYQFFTSNMGQLVFQRNSGTPVRYDAGLLLNTWYHVVATFNTTDGMVLYLDGNTVSTNNTDISITNTNNIHTKIGATGVSTKNFFHGTIDEVRIYNRDLSGQEVQELYFSNN